MAHNHQVAGSIPAPASIPQADGADGPVLEGLTRTTHKLKAPTCATHCGHVGRYPVFFGGVRELLCLCCFQWAAETLEMLRRGVKWSS